jgi:1-acyl-sn-glycerol-3-phosphate acyltransferase
MSDVLYSFIRTTWNVPFLVSRNATVIGREHSATPGPFILAASHASPYDIPLLISHTRRRIDFVTTTEACANPVIGWFFQAMNAFPLERRRADPATVRVLLERLSRDRAVAIFPEGRIRSGADAVVNGGGVVPGLGRTVLLAQVPVVPCVLVGTAVYSKPASWLPLKRARYGIAYGEPIPPPAASDAAATRADVKAAGAAFEEVLCSRMRDLNLRLHEAMA